MESLTYRWYHLRLGTKILLALMLAGAVPLIYAAIDDIFGNDWDRCPAIDVIAIGFILTSIAIVTAVTEWMARHQYLRLHLSTAFILMLLASGCVWLNLQPTSIQKEDSGWWHVEGRGWPFKSTSFSCADLKDAQKELTTLNTDLPYGSWIANALICLGILFLIAFIIEWQIRKTQGASPLAEHAASGNHRHV